MKQTKEEGEEKGRKTRKKKTLMTERKKEVRKHKCWRRTKRQQALPINLLQEL